MSLILHGFSVSPYVRAARIVLIEKGIDYQFNEIASDYLATEDYAKLNPFRKMPVLEQGEFVLYETPAILSYVDEGFEGISLQPVDLKARAQMRKWIGIADNYFYPTGVMQLFVQRILTPIMGGEPDESAIAESVIVTSQHLDVLEQELVTPFLIGDTLSLADILTGAMVCYINMTREGMALVSARPKTAEWLDRLSQRVSFQNTNAELLAGRA